MILSVIDNLKRQQGVQMVVSPGVFLSFSHRQRLISRASLPWPGMEIVLGLSRDEFHFLRLELEVRVLVL